MYSMHQTVYTRGRGRGEDVVEVEGRCELSKTGEGKNCDSALHEAINRKNKWPIPNVLKYDKRSSS